MVLKKTVGRMSRMSIPESIRTRRSVRTFDAPLSAGDREKILSCAAQAENPYGIPVTWRLLEAKQYGLKSPVIVGAETYLAGKMARVPHAEEAFGFSFERIALFAESLGLGTTCIAGTMNRDAFERAMGLAGGEVLPCVTPLGVPAGKMSLRESMMRKGVKADSRLPFGELFFDGSFDAPLTPEAAGALSDVLEAVRLAPSAVNKQPWRVVLAGGKAHFYEKRSQGYVSGNGWDIQKIDMGIALCHFALTAEACGLSVSFETADPGLTVPENTEYIASYRIEG